MGRLPVPSMSVQARQRLGEEPLVQLFGLLTQAWSRNKPGTKQQALADAGRGQRDVGEATDTPESRAQLGRCSTQHGPLPWPQSRGICLMDRHSHELLDAQLGGMDCGELSLAAQPQGEEHLLTLFDRAYFSAAFLLDWHAAGEQRHWLMRAKDNLRHKLIKWLTPGDALIRMPLSQRARQQHPQRPRHWQARLIEVDVGDRRQRFITSLEDHRAHAARALADLYRQRWEIEWGFREIKRSLQDGEPVLRRK